ncbi:MAG: 50S ribosomal protein L20 [candidate division WS6 bacterium OLB20]|uniref:Large ribosomal subunit protein bL20 n=1 Tax=candidate division WS6 bacterium OLB20 TaxID=1617426 RepID=A0A136LY06_9BACT|nr:MAG: 50S ribosomal protein L20 [candidate division WS6 bacterium OLB20]
MRVKRGITKKRKHKKVLEQTKGFRLSYSKLYRRAREALLHAKQYSYGHRRKRQGQFRRLWIERINAGLTESEMKYSTFIHNLKTKNIELNRKILADLALNHTSVFAEVVKSAK